VAIPARNEASVLPECLARLSAQRDAGAFGVLVLANNCDDDTAAEARRMAPRLGFALRVEECDLPAASAHAGTARRLAMERADAWLAGQPDGVLLATDADARPDRDWIARCRRHLAGGCDAVAGQAAFAPGHGLPAPVVQRSLAEARLARLIDRIASLIDPLPWDPWPRHSGHWGANFAVLRSAYRRCGGVPSVPLAEDRALFAALDRCGARVRHAEDVVVHVLARQHGRAPGGMADVLHRRATSLDPLCDAAIEPVRRAVLGARVRRMLRGMAARQGCARHQRLAARLATDAATLRDEVQARGDAEVWHALRARCPRLRPERVALAALAQQTRAAERVVTRLTGRPPDPSCDPPLLTLV
jgi:hypothetical protein